MAPAPPADERPASLVLPLGAATLARLFLNTARRFPYPFAPALGRGLDVPLAHITSLIAINQASSLSSPLLGPLTDRVGSRVMMVAGLGLLSAGMLIAGCLPSYAAVLAGLLLAGLGKACFDPALLAFVGRRVPFRRRGRAIGAVELAWAGSSLVGIPLAGVLIEHLGWRAPFLALGIAGLLCAGLLALLLPPSDGGGRGAAGFGPAWRALGREPAARAALGYSFLFAAGNDSLFIVYGVWLEREFGLGVLALGTATTVIGVAELVGEGLTAAAADRIGLGRAAIAGLALTALGYLLLPVIGRTLPLALATLFVAFLAFEFTVVTALSLFTELLPRARATMMSGIGASSSLGRVTGAMLGGPLWALGGLPATATVAAALTGLALACLGSSLRSASAGLPSPPRG